MRNNAVLAPLVMAAARTRIRPILMTTAAMVGGLLPLMFASGAGAGSQRAIATVLVTGLLIGTMFTLFVLPAIYARFGRQLASPSVTNDRRFSDMEVMS